jgi:hypothetical protein
MPSDIRDLLRDAAAAPTRDLDVPAAVSRAKRLRRIRVTKAIVGALVAVAVVSTIAPSLLDRGSGDGIQPATSPPPQRQDNDGSDSESVARQFGFGRLPGGDVRLCPEGPFAEKSPSQADVRRTAARIVRAANSPRPRPDALWELLDPVLQDAYGSREEFSAALEGTPVPRVYRRWRVSDQVWGPKQQRLLDIEAFCGKEVASAAWMGSAHFPRFEGVSGGVAQMFFLIRADGLRLWFTY